MNIAIRVSVLALALVGVLGTPRCIAQQTENASPDQPQKTGLSVGSELPYEFMKQLVLGFYPASSIRSDLSDAQLQEMKKIWQSANNYENQLHQVQNALDASPWRCRRLTEAVQQARRKSELETLKEWMAQLTPQQIADLRRRNRHAIASAIFNEAQRQTPSIILNLGAPLESAITNKDYLSILEVPRYQDLLELTDEQYQMVMDQVESARRDAENTIQDALREIAAPLPSDSEPRETPTNIRPVNVLVETRKILSAEQWTEYEGLMNDPGQRSRLIEKAGFDKAQSIQTRHGMLSMQTQFQNGQTKVSTKIHNAFAVDAIVDLIKVSSDQKEKIAKVVEQSTEEMNLQATRDAERQRKTQLLRAEQLSGFLKNHIDRVNEPLQSLLTAEQHARLQRELFQSQGLKALQNPLMIKELSLSDEQSQNIAQILMQPGPVSPAMGPFQPGEDFQARSAEMHRKQQEFGLKAREHKSRIDAELLKILSEAQAQKFTQLSKYQFAGSSPRIP